MVARLAIGEEEFRRLVSGQVVRDSGAHGRLVVEIVLADIGLVRMKEILESVLVEKTLKGGAAAVESESCGVCEATHVLTVDGGIEEIVSKWGIGPDGRLAPPSQGGFGVVTKSGRRVGMTGAARYFKRAPNGA